VQALGCLVVLVFAAPCIWGSLVDLLGPLGASVAVLALAIVCAGSMAGSGRDNQ
jgi:hypothetical protein